VYPARGGNWSANELCEEREANLAMNGVGNEMGQYRIIVVAARSVVELHSS